MREQLDRIEANQQQFAANQQLIMQALGIATKAPEVAPATPRYDEPEQWVNTATAHEATGVHVKTLRRLGRKKANQEAGICRMTSSACRFEFHLKRLRDHLADL
jgi:hypothetical protein